MRRGLVLVSGAGGFLGSHIVEVLSEAGYEVRATDLPGADRGPAEAAGASWVEGDLSSMDAARRAVSGVRGVINAAGLFDFGMPFEQLYVSNVQVTDNLCTAAVEAGVDKFVHISSVGVYGPPMVSPQSESAPFEPRNDYEQTKRLAEELVWKAQRFRGLRATVLRPAVMYGPRGRYIAPTLMALFALGRDRRYDWLKTLRGGALGHHVHVRDVARASALVLRKSESIGQAYNVGDTTPLRWGELMTYLAQLTRFEGSPLPLPLGRAAAVIGAWMPSVRLITLNRVLSQDWEEVVRQQGLDTPLVPRLDRDMFSYLAQDHVYDISALHRLGFKPEHPVTLSGLRDTFDWIMAQGWLPGSRDLAQN